ncbi:MAG: hypothetical protein QXY55_05980, partial [Candidatus Korarchaeota archaeon]
KAAKARSPKLGSGGRSLHQEPVQFVNVFILRNLRRETLVLSTVTSDRLVSDDWHVKSFHNH